MRRLIFDGLHVIIQVMHFEIVGKIHDVETIAVGGRIRDVMRLRRQYGEGRWRKLKGLADVRISSGKIKQAEASLV